MSKTKAKAKREPFKVTVDPDKVHSPEPWRVEMRPYSGWHRDKPDDFLGDILDSNGERIYSGPSSFRALHRVANAKRIAACVNALAGVPTDKLEGLAPGKLAPIVNAVLALVPGINRAKWPLEYDGWPARAVGTHKGCRLKGTGDVVMLVKAPVKRMFVCGCDQRLRDEEVEFYPKDDAR